MKLAVSTLACDGWDLDYAVKVCSTCGIQALEVRMGIHDWSDIRMEDVKVKEIYEKINAGGLEVSDLATGVVVSGYQEESLDEIERCAQIANLWKCRGLRIMLGNFRGRWSEPPKPLDYEGIIQWLRAADPIMEQYHTEIWIETHNEFAEGKILKKVIEDCGCKNCRLIWDIMHPLEAGETIEETMEFMNGLLAHVHIKDGRPKEDKDLIDYLYTKIGSGTIPITDILALLKENSYQGFYSLEWEGKWREELRGEGFEPEKAIEDYVLMMKHL